LFDTVHIALFKPIALYKTYSIKRESSMYSDWGIGQYCSVRLKMQIKIVFEAKSKGAEWDSQKRKQLNPQTRRK